MFRYSPEEKQKQKIHSLLSNGYKFALVAGEVISGAYRYKYEADRLKQRGMRVVPLTELLEPK
ncbi:hypothetical protein H2Y56_21870 [Pectobacterium aroidearum]|uniref:Uncharacterized protein n=1 Tax=Pectobacterium aroidearum TaxID=1201031 RepID=A0ABR5ZJI7_9GAMM|nr:hypothetical protein [Pectobacterium aroidearum]MBA5234731.1 hypothetical protein [Pectobacterium aroidearum]MBA5739909.1 hypothetical protein [Pectobacterium aroidearum]